MWSSVSTTSYNNLNYISSPGYDSEEDVEIEGTEGLTISSKPFKMDQASKSTSLVGKTLRKRDASEITPFQKKLCKIDLKNVRENFSSQVKKLRGIEETITKREKNENLSFNEYENAYNQFSTLQVSVLSELLNQKFKEENSSLYIEGIQLLLDVVNPFPISREIVETECEILEKAKNICIDLNTPELIPQINLSQIQLKYNYASLFSKKIASKMKELEAKKNEKNIAANWVEIFKLFEKEIELFKELKKEYDLLKMNDLAKVCNQSILASYEHLADYHYDCAQHLEGKDKIAYLEKAIFYYEKNQKHSSKQVKDITDSIEYINEEIQKIKSK